MKTLIGKIVSTKMQNTVVIERELKRTHPLYKKTIRRNARVKAHSVISLNEGDLVEFIASKPFSKDKHFLVVRKLS